MKRLNSIKSVSEGAASVPTGIDAMAVHMAVFVPVFMFVAMTTLSFSVDALSQGFRSPAMNAQYHRALTAWSTGNSLLEAKARIDRVLRELPDDLESRKLRSAILLDLDKSDAAYRDAVYATRLAPDDAEAHLLVCEASSATGRTEIANAALETASNLFYDQISHYVRLSACALSLGEQKRAESIARIAVASDEDDPRGHIQLARVFLQSGNRISARTVLSNAIDRSIVTLGAILKDPQLSILYLDAPVNQH